MTRIKPSRRPYSGVGPVVSWPNNIAVSRTTPNNQDNTSPHRPNEKVSSRPHLSSYRSAYPRHAPPIPNNKHQLPRHRLQRPIYRHKQRATAPPTRPNWTAIHKRLKEKKKAAFAADLKARGLTEFDIAWQNYNKAYETRIKTCRKWVYAKLAEHRFDNSIAQELIVYWGHAKFGDRPSARTLSKYACQALELSEHDLGTDLAWAKGVVGMLGEWGPVFERMIDARLEGYAVSGPGYVGEEDLESWVGDSDRWEGEEDGNLDDGDLENGGLEDGDLEDGDLAEGEEEEEDEYEEEEEEEESQSLPEEDLSILIEGTPTDDHEAKHEGDPEPDDEDMNFELDLDF